MVRKYLSIVLVMATSVFFVTATSIDDASAVARTDTEGCWVAGETLTETTGGTAAPSNFGGIQALVTDYSGKYIYAATNKGLYISKTSGSTWSRVTEFGTGTVWGVATDSTGRYVYGAKDRTSGILVSSNYGESFTVSSASIALIASVNESLGMGGFASGVTTNSTGQYVYVSAGEGLASFYKSTDWGVSFTKVLASGLKISSLATGGNTGEYLLSGTYNKGNEYYTSVNSGTAWTTTAGFTGGGDNWDAVAMSSDGRVQVITNALSTVRSLKLSTNYGANFALSGQNFLTADGNPQAVTNVAMSADGSVIVAGGEGIGIGGWMSIDSGANFKPIATLTGSYASAYMRSSAVSGDGSKVYSIFETKNKFAVLIKNPIKTSITANYSMGLESGTVTTPAPTTSTTGQCGGGLILAKPVTSVDIDGSVLTFVGWEDPSGKLWYPGTPYSGSLTNNAISLTASWSATSLKKITYNNNGTYNGGTTTGTSPSNQYFATGVSTRTLAINSGLLALGTAVLTGWNTAANGSGTSYSLGQTGVSVETNTVLYAQWAGPVTYKANTGVGNQTGDTYTVSNGSITLPETSTFTKTGYSFVGWGISADSTESVTTYSTLSAVNRYAIWSHNEYGVTFHPNNVSATGTMAIESKTATTALTANSFALANNVFLSWNTTESGTGTSYSDGQSFLFLANTSLYAQWGSVITYTTVGADSGLPSRSSEDWSGGAITSLPTVGDMKKAGYSLGGWSDGTTTYTNPYTPTTGITLNPVWTPNTYTVSFNMNGANSGTVPSDQTWDESVTALTLSGNTGPLVKHGYTFVGWATSASSTSAVTTFSSTSDTLTHTRYAIWTPVSYSVSYVLNGGTSSVDLIESSHTINETFTVATAIPVRDTYVFGGWSNGSTVYPSGASYTVETSTITLTAQWIAQFTVHYIMNGSTSPKDDDALYPSGTAITTAAAPSRTGYTFNYWLANNSLTPAAIESFTVIANSNLTATWTAIDYSVTYAVNGGSSTAPTHAAVNINDIFYLDSANPIKAGYLFTAWFDGTNTYGAGASYAVGSVDIILTAQWTAISYKVTYDLGGGVGTLPTHANVSITDSFTVSTENDPTWLAHTFAGWSDGTATYTKIATYTTGSNNITLTALWTLNGYTTITYALGGGSGTLPTHAALLEGSEFEVASGIGLAKTGQAFNGWNDATNTYQLNEIYVVGSYTAPIVLTAQWATGYSVTYSADTATATGTLPTDSVLRIASATFTLSSGSTLIRSGYTFAGWSNGGITSLGGTSQTIGNANVIYTAEWTLIVVTAPSAEPRPVRKVEVVPVVIVVVKLTPATELTSPVVAAQIALINNQGEAKNYFTAIPKPVVNIATQSSSSPRASQVKNIGVLTSINTQSATTNSLQTANFNLPATEIVLSDLVVKSLELQVKLVATDSGFSVKPVAGFTGVLVIPVVATIDGVQITVLNRVVVNPVAPVAIGFTPKSVKESSISWSPSASQVVAYVVEVNGKTLCQTTSSSCPVPTLIGPNSMVTISALGNDQTSSETEVIPYVAQAPIPALTVAFALNSSRLSSAQKSELRRIAKIIDREGFTRLVVSGFTDAQGGAAANKVLSAARAKATAAFLTQLLPEITVKSAAYGSKKPVKAGKSATAFEANRRSEISVW